MARARPDPTPLLLFQIYYPNKEVNKPTKSRTQSQREKRNRRNWREKSTSLHLSASPFRWPTWGDSIRKHQMGAAVTFLSTSSPLREQGYLPTFNSYRILLSKVVNIHIVLRWVTHCKIIIRGVEWGDIHSWLDPVTDSHADERGSYHFIKAIALHLSTARSTSLFLWRKKLCTKYAQIFLKSNNWSTVGPACQAKSLISRPSTGRGLFHTALNTVRILFPNENAYSQSVSKASMWPANKDTTKSCPDSF